MTTATKTKWTESLSDQQRADMIRFWSRNAMSSPFALVMLERLCDELGLMLMSAETADLAMRLEAGLSLTDDELNRLSYALAAGRPPRKI